MNYEEKWNELQEKLERALENNRECEHNALTEKSRINYQIKADRLQTILWIMVDMINPADQKEYGEIR